MEPIALVAALRCPIEDRIVGHQKLDPSGPGRIRLINSPVLQDEGSDYNAKIIEEFRALGNRSDGGAY